MTIEWGYNGGVRNESKVSGWLVEYQTIWRRSKAPTIDMSAPIHEQCARTVPQINGVTQSRFKVQRMSTCRSWIAEERGRKNDSMNRNALFLCFRIRHETIFVRIFRILLKAELVLSCAMIIRLSSLIHSPLHFPLRYMYFILISYFTRKHSKSLGRWISYALIEKKDN